MKCTVWKNDNVTRYSGPSSSRSICKQKAENKSKIVNKQKVLRNLENRMSKCEIRSLGVQDCEFMQVEKISNGYNIIWKIPAGGDHSKHSKKLIMDAFECNLLAEAFHVILIWICKNERRCRLPLLHLQMRNRLIICHFYALFKKSCNFVSNWMIFKGSVEI